MSRSSLTRFLSKSFLFYTIVMIIKSTLTSLVIFDDIPVWKPLLTELPLIWIIFCLIEWFATRRRMWVYLGVNLLLSGIFFAAIMYYKYYGVIVNYHALAQVKQVTAVKSSTFSLLDPYYLFIFADVIIIGVILLHRSIRLGKTERPSRIWHVRKSRRRATSVVLLLSLVLCMLNIYPNRASMNEITQAEQMGILGYEAYTILDRPEKPVPIQHIDQTVIDNLKQTAPLDSPISPGTAYGRNVIMIQLESFQHFLIGLEVDGQEITPNLNRFAEQGLYFPNFYQQVGQGNTSDAEFVVNTSFYTPPNGAATTVYADKALPSLPKLMSKHGYETATFHTNDVRFWNRDELYQALGFDRYYDMDYFGTQDTIAFAASDEVLYTKTLDKLEELNAAGAPFYAHVISMSAHHPYSLPENKITLTLPERYQHTLPGDYLVSQHYADQAIGQFIQGLKERGLWENSLFILYGDHLGLPIYSLDHKDERLMREIYGREYTSADMINVPLMIYAPGITPAVQLEQIGGHVDILPTIAGLMGLPLENQLHFGQDLLREAGNLLPERYYLPSGSVLNDTSLFIPATGYGDGTHYSLADAGRKGAKKPEVSTLGINEQAVGQGNSKQDDGKQGGNNRGAEPHEFNSYHAGQEDANVPVKQTPQASTDQSDLAKETSGSAMSQEAPTTLFITKDQYDRALDLVHLSHSYLSQLPDRKKAK